MMVKNLVKICGLLMLSACGQVAHPPVDIAGIEKAFDLEICKSSKVKLVDNLGVASPGPVYEIRFPDDKCIDDFLKGLTRDSIYEHPFDDKNKLLGSNEKKRILFSTTRTSDRVVILHVTDTSWMDKK